MRMEHVTLSFDWPFLGNESLTKFLKRQLQFGTLSHAYLFWGPASVGKMTLAQFFIASILCSSQTTEAKSVVPCRSCIHCRQLEKKVHPDVVTVSREFDEKAEKMKKNISIEQIRILQGQLDTGTFLNSYKIVLITEADVLSIEAANSLLKSLEEPHKKIIFILISTNRESLPATILSRCQVFQLKTSPLASLISALEARGVAYDTADLYARLSMGLPGRAINLMSNNLLVKKYQEDVQHFLAFCDQSISQRLVSLDEYLDWKQDHQQGAYSLEQVFNAWLLLLRDMLVMKNATNSPTLVRNLWCQESMRTLVMKWSSEKLILLIEYLEGAKRKLRENINAKLLTDNFLFLL